MDANIIQVNNAAMARKGITVRQKLIHDPLQESLTIVVASFDPSTRKIAVDSIRRQDTLSITSSHIVLLAGSVTNRTISQTPPPSLSFE